MRGRTSRWGRNPKAGICSPSLTSTVSDTSSLLSEDSLTGRLVHTLIGYTDRPNGAQLVVYLLTIAIIVGLMRSQRLRTFAASSARRSSSEIS
jgi:high-affinity Fe2+/Pb2+ permease